jgi:hypothetical protein
MSNNNLFTEYLNSDACAMAASNAIREAAAATVIANTAQKARVDESFYEFLKKEAKSFTLASRIIVTRGADSHKIVADLCFCGSESQKMEKLLKLLQTIHSTEMWYEDRCSQTLDGPYEGFCWEGPNNEFFFCGYPIPQESQPEDWDYDNQAIVPANTNTAKKGSSRKA